MKPVSALQQITAILELAGVLLAAGAIYLMPALAPWPLLVGPVFWLLQLAGRVLFGWRMQFWAGLDAWVVLLVASSGAALWASYDPALGLTVFGPAGVYKFWLICAAALVYFAIARLPERRSVWLVSAGFGLLGVLVSVYFILTHDFSGDQVKFSWLNRLGLWLQMALSPGGALSGGRALHPNVAGGLMAMSLPLLLQMLVQSWRWERGNRPRLPVMVGSAAAAGLCALGLVLSSSRGAWLGLAAALGGRLLWAFLGRIYHRRGGEPPAVYRLRFGVLAAVFLTGGVGVILTLPRLIGLFPPFLGGENTLISRLDLMQEAQFLVRAAPFTGIGLGTFPLVFSTEVLLIGVPFIAHAHNLFLNLLVSQGWPGLLVYLGLLIAALYLAYNLGRRAEGRWPLAGAVMMLVVSLVHGMVDDPLYGSRGLIFWLAPLGLIAAAARQAGLSLPNPFAARWSRLALAGMVLALFAVTGLFWQNLAAAFETNLGVVTQARIELAVYDPDHFQQRTLDQVRQEVDLTSAEVHFQRALERQPGQVIARQHLADLSLSLGQYEQALNLIQPVWAGGERDRVTRLIYGSTLVANGQPQAAAAVFQGITWAESRINGEAWYRYFQHGDYQRAADAYRVILLLDPGNEQARYGLSEAEKRGSIEGTLEP